MVFGDFGISTNSWFKQRVAVLLHRHFEGQLPAMAKLKRLKSNKNFKMFGISIWESIPASVVGENVCQEFWEVCFRSAVA